MADDAADNGAEPDEPAWDCDILYALRAYSNYATQDLAKRLAPWHVTVAEWAVLESLQGGPSAPAELAKFMGITRGAVSRLADRLVQKSLVKRKKIRADGHNQMLALTPKGAALVPELARVNGKAISEIFWWLRKNDRSHLERILKDLVRRYREVHGLD